jgi:putative FmdB family regulatory protein
MPTYDYHCDACDHEFEEFQSITEKPLKKCPACGKSKLRRLFGTGAAVLFKGSGFYQTDYRSESYKSAAKAEQEATKPSTSDKDGAKSSAKGETAKSGTAASTKAPKSKAKASDD